MQRISLFIFFFSLISTGFSQSIQNVSFRQTEEDKIVVTYDIISSEGQTFDVTLSVSPDGGRNFTIFPRTLTGDVGEKVAGGRGKMIIWDVLSDIRRLEGTNFVFKVIAKTRGGETLTDIDGNVYKTIKIGGQVWMAENLKVTRYRSGNPIPNVTIASTWANLTTGACCAYDNNNKNIETYGLLYNWYAVNDSRNIAPAGWHVPTDEEWKQLEKYLGMSQSDTDNEGWRGTDQGGKLKEVATTHWSNPNTGATNSSRFTALPGGSQYHGKFYDFGNLGYWWSSTANGNSYAWYRGLRYDKTGVYRRNDYKLYFFNVRLVKD